MTGGSIGRAIAVALAEAGADVAVHYRTRESDAWEVRRRIEALGRRAIAVGADVSVAADVSRLIATVERELGPVDILVNNAGVGRPQALEDITERDWDAILDVNLKSAFLVTQAVLPGMRARRRGAIVNLSSVAAQFDGIVGPHYSASKAGLLGLTHYYASLLAKEGVTVNAIAPGLIDTEMVGDNPRATPNLVPVGRFGTPEEVAAVAVMLAGNRYITGQTINVNGGRYMS